MTKKSKSENRNILTLEEAETLLNDLQFFAREVEFFVQTLKDAGLDSAEIFSCNNIRIGHERMMPGLARLRHSLARAIQTPQKTTMVDLEIKNVAEKIEKFKKGKKDG